MSSNTQWMQVKFWGVRGSVPAPLTGRNVEDKVVNALVAFVRANPGVGADPDAMRAWVRDSLPFAMRSTIGGNTSCVTITIGDETFVLDMGTGLRVYGNSVMPRIRQRKSFFARFFGSHKHWDHIQGFPFFRPTYMPRRFAKVAGEFFGGRFWDKDLEEVLQGQMTAPMFPVDLHEIQQTAMEMKFTQVSDGWTLTISVDGHDLQILSRKLNHPQETFGYRFEYRGRIVAYTTDHEPFAAGVAGGLLELAKDADVWITDCQYEDEQYAGRKDGVARHGWGHSFPTYIAEVVKAAGAKLIVVFHHDPDASDEDVIALAHDVMRLSGVRTVAAYEGLTIEVGEETEIVEFADAA